MLLGMRIGVRAVRQEAGVVPMHHIVDVVLGEELGQEVWRQVVRHPCTPGPSSDNGHKVPNDVCAGVGESLASGLQVSQRLCMLAGLGSELPAGRIVDQPKYPAAQLVELH